jgi:hypothetical protein
VADDVLSLRHQSCHLPRGVSSCQHIEHRADERLAGHTSAALQIWPALALPSRRVSRQRLDHDVLADQPPEAEAVSTARPVVAADAREQL